jgi:iron complex outermembrane receptor protein
MHLALDVDKVAEGPLLKDATIALDVRNLFDREPPFVNILQAPTGGGGFDPTNASTIGRIVSLQITKKFF